MEAEIEEWLSRAAGRKEREHCLLGTEFHFGKLKKFQMGGDDG